MDVVQIVDFKDFCDIFLYTHVQIRRNETQYSMEAVWTHNSPKQSLAFEGGMLQ